MYNRKKIIEIKDIVMNQEQLHKIREFKERRPTFSWSGQDYLTLMRSTAGGVCCVCSGIPSKLVRYKMGKFGIAIEKYCSPCFKKHLKDTLDGIDEKVTIKLKK